MRRVKISAEQADVLLAPRGPYHVTLEQLFSMEKIIFPAEYDKVTGGVKELPLLFEEKDGIFLFKGELEPLKKVVSRNGKNLAEAIGLNFSRISEISTEDGIIYKLDIQKDDPAYYQARLLFTAKKYVSNIHFIDTVRGDVYIRCTISRWEQVAKRMKRTHSRSMDRSNRTECMKWITYYYREELEKHYLK